MPIYEFTHQLAALEPPPPEMQAFRRAPRRRRGRPVPGDESTGTAAIEEFFPPENIARIVSAPANGVVV